ncbi:MAG: hypothetical protein ACKOC5_12150 [Chloroflexota bacterium]
MSVQSQTRVGDLEIEQDETFQQRDWKLERAGWLVIALLLALAALGLFGEGLLSRRQIDAGVLQMEYQRFVRYGAAAELRVTLAPGAAQDGQAQIALDRRYLGHFQLEQVLPEPSSVDVQGHQVVFRFAWSRPEQPFIASFLLIPQRVGRVQSSLAAAGGQADIWQFVYP